MINLSMDDEDVRSILRCICELEDFARLGAFKNDVVFRSRSHIALSSLSESALAVHSSGRDIIAKGRSEPDELNDMAPMAIHLQYVPLSKR